MSSSAHNTSVEIVAVIQAPREERLKDRELQYPTAELWTGPLNTRGHWMAQKNEWWCYSVEPEDEEGVTPIKLESWVRSRTSHHLLFEYGRVYRTIINWDGWTVITDVIACHQMIPVEDMPRVLEVGKGTAFVVSTKAWEAYRKMALKPKEAGEVSAGTRLLYHILLNRDLMGEDFTVKRFSEWPASMILDLMVRRMPDEKYQTFTPVEAGLLEDPNRALEIAIQEARREVPQECLLAESKGEDGVEAEPMKNKALHFVFPDVGNSPELTPKRKRMNDVDELPRRRRKRNAAKGPRAPGSRPRKWAKKRTPASPLKLTIEQERGIVRTLVLCINPGATEEEIKENQDAVSKLPLGVPEEKPGPYSYGAGPGEWQLSKEEIEETMKEVKEGSTSSMGRASSSNLSPRGELSQNLSTSAQEETPSPKKQRRVTEELSESSVPMSPFLSMHSSGGKIVSISSSSSPMSDEEGKKTVRVSLGDLLGSGRIIWPENGLFAQIQVEMQEDTDEQGQDGEFDQDEVNEIVEGQDQTSEDEIRE